MNNDLCPGCEELVIRNTTRQPQSSFEDAVERPWHHTCAKRTLADHFRTPLSPADASAEVAFECSAEHPWRAPHSFHLRKIVLEEDVAISGVFVGQYSMVYCYHQPIIHAVDLPDRSIIMDCDVPLGIDLTVTGSPKNLWYTLVGDRRREGARPKPMLRYTLAAAPIYMTTPISPGGFDEASFSMVASFHGERVVCEDWRDWEIVSVKVGGGPGRGSDKVVRLTGLSTPLPTYEVRVAETITYTVKNVGDTARTFRGRVYGMLSY